MKPLSDLLLLFKPAKTGILNLLLLTSALMLSPATVAEDSPDSAIALPEFPALSEFDVIVQRPLFNNNRRPGQKSSAPSGGDEQSLRGDWKLTGISITPHKAIALFEERKGNQRLRLESGMLLDGNWQIDVIDADAVSVISGDQVVRLELRQPRKKQDAPQTNNNQQPEASDSAADDETKGPTTPNAQNRSRLKRTM